MAEQRTHNLARQIEVAGDRVVDFLARVEDALGNVDAVEASEAAPDPSDGAEPAAADVEATTRRPHERAALILVALLGAFLLGRHVGRRPKRRLRRARGW